LLPVFLNKSSGSAGQAHATLKTDIRIDLRCSPAKELKAAITQLVESGAPRIAVCGGDGTLALAASCLAGTETELAVLPGGTLNHFAKNSGIPSDLADALELALTGQAEPVAAGYVNGQLFLNTSSVGAYVQFVRTREHLEEQLSYPSASLLAGLRRLLRFRSAKIDLNGTTVRSPLVFIGVHERDLQFPSFGQKKTAGNDGLHVIAIRAKSRWDSFKIAAKALLWGVDPLAREKDIDSQVLKELQLHYRNSKRKQAVALDGELLTIQVPLQYRYAPKALQVVLPQR